MQIGDVGPELWTPARLRRTAAIRLPGPLVLGASAGAWLLEAVLVLVTARWAGIHASFGDALVVVGTSEVETQQTVERRIWSALEHIDRERLVIAPDCGMKYLPRRAAFDKLQVMARAARAVREQLRVSSAGGSRA